MYYDSFSLDLIKRTWRPLKNVWKCYARCIGEVSPGHSIELRLIREDKLSGWVISETVSCPDALVPRPHTSTLCTPATEDPQPLRLTHTRAVSPGCARMWLFAGLSCDTSDGHSCGEDPSAHTRQLLSRADLQWCAKRWSPPELNEVQEISTWSLWTSAPVRVTGVRSKSAAKVWTTGTPTAYPGLPQQAPSPEVSRQELDCRQLIRRVTAAKAKAY